MLQQRLYEAPIQPQQPQPSSISKDIDSDSWDYHYYKIISSLEGTFQQKQAIIRKRILRYFGEFKIDSESYFSLRNDVDYNTPGIQIISSKIILYGVDYLTIERTRNYFQGFITNIRRMDDSHFLVQFRNQNQCLGAINRCKKQGDVFFSSSEAFSKSKNGWIQFRSYYQFIFQRRLMARFCTNMDRFDNLNNMTKKSYTLAYSEAKRRFFKSLKQDIQKCQKRNQNKGYNARSNSRSRSKQRFNYKNQERHLCGKQRGYNNRIIGQCQCQNSNKSTRSGWQRNDSRSKQRSSSLSSNYSSQDQFGRKKRLPRLLEQEKIKQADFKFQLYIKRRDQALNKKPQSQSQPQLTNLFSGLMQPFPCSKDKTKYRERQKSFSTTQQDCCQVPSQVHFSNMVVKSSNQYANNEMNAEQSEQVDFQMFLEKLKLEDSKNQYSAFDLDLMDG